MRPSILYPTDCPLQPLAAVAERLGQIQARASPSQRRLKTGLGGCSSKDGLHLRQPLRIGGPGPVDHQEPTQEIVALWPHRQAAFNRFGQPRPAN